jgi:hypothetical protein
MAMSKGRSSGESRQRRSRRLLRVPARGEPETAPEFELVADDLWWWMTRSWGGPVGAVAGCAQLCKQSAFHSWEPPALP